MTPFRSHTGLVAPLDRANIDTDQIIPKQFLKRVERTGFGQFLFFDWRYLPSGQPDASFILNQSRYEGATVLVTGKNFGCGSSREHAPWSLLEFGFRAIIAPSFADIFANNCFKNGMLPITLPQSEVQHIIDSATNRDGYVLTIDLEKQIVQDESGFSTAFAVDPFQRYCLLEGLDDIGLTLRHESEIQAYELAQEGKLTFK